MSYPPAGLATPEHVAAQLLRSSSVFARSAARSYTSESWETFFLHLATATEQLVKAVLATAHPSFIADPRGGFDSLLHLSGMGHRAKSPVAAVRTISVSEALDRVRRLVDDYRDPAPEVRLLLDARNGIVHAGANTKGQGEVLLAETSRYLDSLLPSVGSSPAEYWGEFLDMIETHTRQRLTEIEGAYTRRLQAARDRFADLTREMEDDELAAYKAAIERTEPSPDFSSFPVECPACGSFGQVIGSPVPDWEVDWDVSDGEAYAAGGYVDLISLEQPSYQCRVCGLHLPSTMFEFVDIDTIFSHRGAFDVSEATDYFTQQIVGDDWYP